MTDSPIKPNAPWAANYERKLLLSFGAVVFLLIVVIFAASNWLFHRAETKNVNQLASTVTQVISHALNKVSFSGKYHTRNLVQELTEEDFRLNYIAVQNNEGVYFAHSNPEKNDQDVSAEDIAMALDVFTTGKQKIFYRTVDKLSILEVVTPFRSGYEQQITGVVRVGISIEESNADLQRARLYLTLLSIFLAGISIFIINRISRYYGSPVQQMAQTLQGIMDHAPMAIFLHTKDGLIVQANLEFKKVFGAGSELGSDAKVSDFVTSLEYGICPDLDKEVFSNNKAIRSEVELTADGETRTVLVSKFPVGYDNHESKPVICTFLFDITATRDLETQLRQSQKMEAIGHLAGGVAHDFNNLLTGIIGYADLALMITEGKAELEEYLTQLLTAANRASQLTHGLLAFSRKQVMDLNPVDLNLIVDRMESLLMRVIGEDIVLTSNLDPFPVTILADAPQIEQIILNLATNSRDAMPRGGSLNITTSRLTIRADDPNHPDLEAGQYAVLEVTDTGCGIPLNFQDKVFDPFFTTKEVGKGTGLGLSMAYGIIKQHSGKIALDSEPENGTTTQLLLPIADELQPVAATPSVEVEARGGHEKILLVEDEKFVRDLLYKILTSAGYDVVKAEDGKVGLESFLAQADSFDLVLMDMIMPRMNGQESCTEMRKIRPELKVLFISGYTANHIKKHTNHEGELNIIYKPVRRNNLLGKIRNVLNGE